jgi:hypothetical protein
VGVVEEDGAAMGGVGHAAGEAALLTHAALSAPGRAEKQIPISKSAPFQGGLAAAFGPAAPSSCPAGQEPCRRSRIYWTLARCQPAAPERSVRTDREPAKMAC